MSIAVKLTQCHIYVCVYIFRQRLKLSASRFVFSLPNLHIYLGLILIHLLAILNDRTMTYYTSSLPKWSSTGQTPYYCPFVVKSFRGIYFAYNGSPTQDFITCTRNFISQGKNKYTRTSWSSYGQHIRLQIQVTHDYIKMGVGTHSRFLVGRSCQNSIRRWRSGNIGYDVLWFNTYPYPLGIYHCIQCLWGTVNNRGKLII